MRNAVALLVFSALVLAAATTGMAFQPGEWYAGLIKPSWTPPNWAFPVAWTMLYIMIALAGWLAWRREGVAGAVAVWAIGLGFNALWSYLMFGCHEIGLALADLIALWLSIVAFILLAWRPARTASLMFVPYLAWVTFAGALNYAVWQLN